MKQVLPILVAATMLLAAGIAHGLRTDRWGKATEVIEAGQRLQHIPPSHNDWASDEVHLDARQLEIAHVTGYLCRRYIHQITGSSLTLLIVAGRPGAIGAHTPDVCYQGAGYRMDTAANVVSFQIPDTTHTFWHTTASRGGPQVDRLALWWAWSHDGIRWEASREPRMEFARFPFLYKMYLIRPVDRFHEDNNARNHPVQRFLEDWVPLLGTHLASK
jgi:hypothetical protein